jgi:hypothetical protein
MQDVTFWGIMKGTTVSFSLLMFARIEAMLKSLLVEFHLVNKRKNRL